jgi:hypothetical protein
MSVSDKIYKALEKKGFEPDPPEDTNLIYKVLTNGISLYFQKESDSDNERGPWIGLWVADTVSSTVRNNLKTEFHNAALGNRCGPMREFQDEGGFWINCVITAVDGSLVNWVASTMEEAERRILFMVNR